MVATLMEKAEHCPMCGTAEREWLEDPDAYRAVPHICPGCAAKDRAREASETDKTIPGSSIRLITGEQAARLSATKAKRPMSRRERARGGRTR